MKKANYKAVPVRLIVTMLSLLLLLSACGKDLVPTEQTPEITKSDSPPSAVPTPDATPEVVVPTAPIAVTPTHTPSTTPTAKPTQKPKSLPPIPQYYPPATSRSMGLELPDRYTELGFVFNKMVGDMLVRRDILGNWCPDIPDKSPSEVLIPRIGVIYTWRDESEGYGDVHYILHVEYSFYRGVTDTLTKIRSDTGTDLPEILKENVSVDYSGDLFIRLDIESQTQYGDNFSGGTVTMLFTDGDTPEGHIIAINRFLKGSGKEGTFTKDDLEDFYAMKGESILPSDDPYELLEIYLRYFKFIGE